VIEAYLNHVDERKALSVPPKPLDPEQTRELVKLLVKPPKGKEEFLLDLLSNRVSPASTPPPR
jgi:aconitate hydratase 2/2-methylisocitrate dehydratase